MKMSLMLGLAAILVSGCYETSTNYTINPDGSGKVVVEVKSASMAESMGKKGGDGAKDLAKDVLKKSIGIDTWKDIEIKMTEDGKNYFKGTGYFSDITKVRFKNISMGDSIAFSKDKNNNLVLELVSKNESKPTEPEKSNMTAAELEAAIKEQKNSYQQMKPMLAAILGTMKTEMSFQLPGKVEKSTNFKKDKDGRLMITFEGQKFMDALDALMADEAWIKKQAMAGSNIKNDPPGGDALNEKIFGEKGPIRAVVKGKTQALFDYSKEKLAAESSYDAMIAALGLDSGPPEAPKVETYKGGSFKNVTIAKMSYSDLADPDNLMFGDDRRYEVTLVGELPGAIIKADRVTLTKVTADNGDDLLPESEWSRETNWADLSKNKAFAKWSFTLAMPKPEVRGLSELTGAFFCQVAGRTKSVDLGIKKFETGAEGKELGAVIESSQGNEYSVEIVLKLNVAETMIKEIQFLNAGGKKIIPMSSYVSSSSEESCSIGFSFDPNFPKTGSIRAELNDDIKTYEIPFSVKNVDLFGKPAK